MASVLHDETIFEDPHKFLPERYLAGDVALKKQRTIPFGLGKFVGTFRTFSKKDHNFPLYFNFYNV